MESKLKNEWCSSLLIVQFRSCPFNLLVMETLGTMGIMGGRFLMLSHETENKGSLI